MAARVEVVLTAALDLKCLLLLFTDTSLSDNTGADNESDAKDVIAKLVAPTGNVTVEKPAKETAVWARARPTSTLSVSKTMAVPAKIVPTKLLACPRTTLLPIAQYTLVA